MCFFSCRSMWHSLYIYSFLIIYLEMAIILLSFFLFQVFCSNKGKYFHNGILNHENINFLVQVLSSLDGIDDDRARMLSKAEWVLYSIWLVLFCLFRGIPDVNCNRNLSKNHLNVPHKFVLLICLCFCRYVLSSHRKVSWNVNIIDFILNMPWTGADSELREMVSLDMKHRTWCPWLGTALHWSSLHQLHLVLVFLFFSLYKMVLDSTL